MRNPFAGAIFFVLSVLLLPVSLIGYVIWVGRGMLSARASRISMTAQGPLTARCFQHELGTRADEAACRLLRALPSIPKIALRLTAGPLLLAHRVTGFVPKAFRYPFEGHVPPRYEASARVTFFDAAVARYLAHMGQFVILGAGFDTRAFRPPAHGRVRSFEVDAPRTQALKRDLLEQAGIEATGVAFVAADFEKEDWLAKLVNAGFDPGKPALFLWEGVTMYLEQEAVETTLRKIAGTARGSAVAFDYFTTEVLESGSLYWRYGRAATKAAGEPLKFGIDSTPPSRARLAGLLEACGLALVEHRTLGRETGGRRAWGGFATAQVERRE